MQVEAVQRKRRGIGQFVSTVKFHWTYHFIGPEYYGSYTSASISGDYEEPDPQEDSDRFGAEEFFLGLYRDMVPGDELQIERVQ